MKTVPTIREVMTSDPETVDIGQPLTDVYTLLEKRKYHHVPVVDGATPVGMISATDILKLVYDIEGSDDDVLRTFLDHQFTLDDAMTTDLVSVGVDEPILAVIEPMSDGRVHSVLVLNDAGELDGIVTSTDLICTLGELVS